MKTQNEINKDILKVTMKIQAEYPELSEYLIEMPVTIPDQAEPHINTKTLQEYCDSLNQMVNKYSHNQTQL